MKKRLLRYSLILLVGFAGLAAAIGPDPDKYFEIMKNIEIYTNLYKEVNTNYVDEIDPGKLMKVGIDAMVASLDPYTNYYSESLVEGARIKQQGKYNGIGAEMEAMDGLITITELYKDQPADQAGLRPGDRILKVDERDARGKSLDELEEIMRGFPGTTMNLTVQRPGKGEMELKVVRGDINIPNVPYYGMLADGIGYVALTTFTQQAGANVRDAVSKLRAENPGMKGVVLDLRNNGGGLLNEAVDIVNIFVPKDEVIVSTRGKVKEWDRTYKTQRAPLDTELPVAVLINPRSASASEIVSGALQDLDRAVLIGQRSYGKGLVQNIMEIGYNSRVKITTAKYYIPSQRCIQSVEYEDGKPVDIVDSKRAEFKTRAGRTVLDGGGVAPDVRLPALSDGGIMAELLEEHLVFDYVTDWALRHPAIDTVTEFHFTDWDDFQGYLQKNGFQYESDAEQALAKLRTAATEEGLNIGGELDKLAGTIDSKQVSELNSNKKELIDLIEKEIAGRYYYQRGMVQMGLRNDREVKEAIAVLTDGERYRKLLQK